MAKILYIFDFHILIIVEYMVLFLLIVFSDGILNFLFLNKVIINKDLKKFLYNLKFLVFESKFIK